MNSLLSTCFIPYLNSSLRPPVVCTPVAVASIRIEIISAPIFDIQDKKTTIQQPQRNGSATYNNPTKKTVAVIDYEHFLNLQPHQPDCTSDKDVIKKLELKKPDFIVYELGGTSFFFINELSQSSKPSNKRSVAIIQMRNALFHFSKVPKIKQFMDNFNKKCCIFSNRSNNVIMPDFANSFNSPNTFFPEPDVRPDKIINRLGFELIETANIDI
ncbi:MAG: hypothetical protein LBV68_01960 [Spirochaetaceae bacterium]|nr:hypothetical protein [Spirochaetaceae bacterium]